MNEIVKTCPICNEELIRCEDSLGKHLIHLYYRCPNEHFCEWGSNKAGMIIGDKLFVWDELYKEFIWPTYQEIEKTMTKAREEWNDIKREM